MSDVTNLSYMFYHDTESFFNADISAWNVGKVVNMTGLLGNAKSFNQSIGSWNVVKVRTMDRMFLGCVAYNQPMNKWNVTQVTSMSYMFSGTQNFQQDIGSWKTTNVNDMSYMFYNAILYNLNFANWNYTKVTSMAGFIGSTSGYNLAKTGALFVRLSKNSTFSKKRINLPTGNISYLATPTSIAAVSSLVGAKKNVFAVTQIVPVITSFKPLNYSISDLTTLGYRLADLLM